MKFYVGVKPRIALEMDENIPTIINANYFIGRRIPLVRHDWMLDSGGFNQILKHGRYVITEKDYLQMIELQKPTLCFCQDWICDKKALQKSGKSVIEHQILTTNSYLRMREKIDNVLPILQGQDVDDYLRHYEIYRKHGVEDTILFGLGSIARDANSLRSARTVYEVKQKTDLRLHGFGLKRGALLKGLVVKSLESADSMDWVWRAWKDHGSRRNVRMTYKCSPCLHPQHEYCVDCGRFAKIHYVRILRRIAFAREEEKRLFL